MKKELKAALIGLDTSHAVSFTKLLQDPSVPEAERVSGMKVTRCLRFKTPFQSEEGMDERQKYLESQGVLVTQDFEAATDDCDIILLTVDDPSAHLEYFRKCAALGKPVYLDKPFADTMENTHRMIELAREKHLRFFTASALRFDPGIIPAAEKYPNPKGAFVYGALGEAPAGSSIVWYSVHCFEILERLMGRGADTVTMIPDARGALCHVAYRDGRRGAVEFIRHIWQYGGILHAADDGHYPFASMPGHRFYVELLRECVRFFRGESEGVSLEDSIEVMAMVEAADKSMKSGCTEPVCL